MADYIKALSYSLEVESYMQLSIAKLRFLTRECVHQGVKHMIPMRYAGVISSSQLLNAGRVAKACHRDASSNGHVAVVALVVGR